MRILESAILAVVALASFSEARPSYGLSWTAFSVEAARVQGVSEACNICVLNCGNDVLTQAKLECTVAECLLQCRQTCTDEGITAVSSLLDKAVATTDGCPGSTFAQYGNNVATYPRSVLATACAVLALALSA